MVEMTASVAEILDRRCVPLPDAEYGINLDCLSELVWQELGGIPDDDDLLEAQQDEIYAWAKARGVRVRI